MKTGQHWTSAFAADRSLLVPLSTALLAVIVLFTTTPVAPAQSVWGNALSFNGANQFVDLGTNAPVMGAHFTQEAWIKPQVSDSDYHGFLGDSPGDNYRSPCLFVSDGRSLHGGFGTGSAWRSWTTGPVLQPNAWNHIAASYDGATYRVYVNGEQVFSIGFVAVPCSTPVRYIGQVGSHFFPGQIDEVRLWNVARTPAQIRDGMCHPLSGTESNLVAYWKFDESFGNAAHDSTTYHRDGTLINSPGWTNSSIPLPFLNMNVGLTGLEFWGSPAWGDYDNDGRLDLLLAGSEVNQTGPVPVNPVWRNMGSGFADVSAQAGLSGLVDGRAAWGDFDNDGWLDIVLAGRTNYWKMDMVTQLWRNNRNRTLSKVNGVSPGTVRASSVAWGDYNNDGRLDLLLTGDEANGHRVSQVWRNNGDGSFNDINAGMPGVVGAAAWGDYDNDGRLDILVAGIYWDSSLIAQVWRNNGDGTFSNINAGLPGIQTSSVAWGDYDNDGRLDILWTGSLTMVGGGPPPIPVTQIWRNTGTGFTNINASLPGVYGGTAAWGDYDNDGRLDILLTGTDGSVYNPAQVWRNNGDGTFSDINAGLPAIYGAAAWGDYDNDGRLDIVLTGSDLSSSRFAQVWRNLGATTNTPPRAPTGLTAEVTGHQVRLSWAAASDAQTPADGLTYNLRIGTTTGACDVLSPQAAVPSGLRFLSARGSVQPGQPGVVVLPYGVYYWGVQAVDTAFAGSRFSEESRLVIYPPQIQTYGASNVTCTGATLHGTANAMEHDTLAWFEYGFDMRYGQSSTKVPIGNGTNDVPLGIPVSGMAPWMTYHYRAVASNCVGVTVGADGIVTLPGPSPVNPQILTALHDITLQQGGSTSVWFAVSPTDLDARAHCSNPVLLPANGLVPGGSGANRSLALVPDPRHSGSALVTITATDGSRSASQTFNVRVTPLAGLGDPSLYLTNGQVASTHAWRFRLVDAGTGSTNYAVEYRPDLSPTNIWMPATNVTALGGGVFEVAIGPPQPGLGFYRAKGFRLLTAGFNSGSLTVEEGAGVAGPVLVFNGIYAGTVTCIWTDEQGTSWTNQVAVNGTTAVIPAPASFLADNATLGELRHLTLQLQQGPGFALGATTRTAVTVEENEADWLGTLQTQNGNLDFTLSLVQTNGRLQGLIKSAGPGFFPTNALAQLSLTADAFTLVATNIVLPVLTDYSSQSFTNWLDLRLDATNSFGATNVSPTKMQGVASLVSKVPGRGYLDSGVFGTYQMFRLPTALSTNEVPLQSAP
jgi:hypothetical protein